MVDLKKDTHFEKCMAEIDDFIQELHEENKKMRELRQQNKLLAEIQELREENNLLAEILELRQQNKMLVAEIQKLQNELNKKNNSADSENKTEDNKTAADLRFERKLKINALLIKILWLEVAAIIVFDIYITFIKQKYLL